MHAGTDVTACNDGMVDALPGEDIVLKSSDRVTEERYTSKVAEEHLNQRIPPGRAVHNLRVKEQCPLILLINLDNTCKADNITANLVYTEAFGDCQTHI